MKYWTLQWGIKERVVLVTVIPVVLMFISIVLWSRLSSYSAIRQELEERGHVVATALAESSQYGVISGNLSYLERTPGRPFTAGLIISPVFPRFTYSTLFLLGAD
jgi:two-component system sensor histidine kinase UhpB